MTRQQQIKHSIRQAGEFIAIAQQPDGSFISLSASSNDYSNALEYHTTFITANILAALSNVSGDLLATTKQRSADFLSAQQSPLGSLNYWDRQSPEFTNLPYPDDLDDTFCALSALANYDPKLITGQKLAHAVQLLTATETKPGGPYKTWLVRETAQPVWQDVDLAVNANINWFLIQQKVVLPDLAAFLEDHVQQNNFRSSYYPTVYPVIYFLARSYQGTSKQQLVDYIFSLAKDGYWDNPFCTALATTALLRLGVGSERLNSAIDYLLFQVAQDFKPWPFCLDPAQNGQKYFAGAASLTAAFCLEAWANYLQQSPTRDEGLAADTQAKQLYQQVVEQVRQCFVELPQPLAQQGQEILAATLKSDNKDQQIVLLTYWFAQALNKPIDNRLLISAGAASLYGWIAYTIYDNILDEAKDTALLPLANACLREVITIYQSLARPNLQNLFTQVMDRLEATNAWEVSQCRLPNLPNYGDYAVLADKSFGHALGPLAVLASQGYEVDSAEMRTAQTMLRHFLIARQLNDDAHDWQEDLALGQVNSVASLLLRQALEHRLIPDLGNIDQYLPALQELFWDDAIHQVSQLILRHCDLARQAALQLPEFDTHFIENLLQPLAAAAKQATEQATVARDFLSAYQ